jgi:hypothetical protein
MLVTAVMVLMSAATSISVAASSIVAAMVIALAIAVISVVVTGVIGAGAGAGVVVDASYHSEESNKQTDRENVSHRISIRSPNSIKSKCTLSREPAQSSFKKFNQDS